jgi:restriction endonuclease S subunit
MFSSNSRYYKKKFSTKKEDVFPEIQTYLYEQLPIPHATQEQQKQIVDIVASILQKRSNKEDTSNDEIYIDILAYHLYSLSYEDIKLIDPETEFTREEYEAATI